jgi:hypothetical protein
MNEKKLLDYNVNYNLIDKRVRMSVAMTKEVEARLSTKEKLLSKPGVKLVQVILSVYAMLLKLA